jgi:hypothetical protein
MPTITSRSPLSEMALRAISTGDRAQISQISLRFEEGFFRSTPLVAGQGSDRSIPAVGNFDFCLSLEDIFSGRRVFYNPIDGRSSSLGAYMTCLDFEALAEALKVIGVDRFCYHDWRRIVGYYRHNWYLSPTFGLLAASIARAVGLPTPLDKSDATVAFYSAPGDAVDTAPPVAVDKSAVV